jgi:hypothetical protein
MRSGAPLSNESSFKEMRLVFFLNSHLKPLLQKASLDGDKSRPSDQARTLELFLWLHHGVEAEYFATDSSRRLMYEYFPSFLRAYESPLAKGNLETWFSRTLLAIFESEFNGKMSLFTFNEGRKQNARDGELELAFESLVILAAGFNRDEKAFPLIDALIAPDSKAWNSMMNNYMSIVSLSLESMSHRDELTKIEPMLDGYFEVVKYLQAHRLASSNIRQETPTIALTDFLRLLKETQQWRLNFGYPTFRERFMGMTALAATVLSQKTSQTPASDLSTLKQSFLNEIYDLMTDWGAPAHTSSAGV